ncbi:acetyltransferase [Rhizobium sp. R72]|uniref:GNAT family N-acetyltransferase n=1 Tax=unclassified Rhizobium TaxID=2613769 RepID=UPI000B529BAA|nr:MULTISPECIES: GNAT family N-acetyltransferase [unclassified Rhizobium]OWV95971.1 acetyltransferase [Rhizobium sp. R693]OWW01653.1 acetyltransferase [Rhizobium sp. R72]OWW01756.1 acetyltransferase [Rhizobium sp. R711]
MIRILGIDDVAIFKAIRLEALRTEPAAFASSAEDWEALSDDEWRKRLVEGPVFAAFKRGDPIGIMGLSRQRASKMAHRATLIMVYVRGSERAGGHAKELLEATVAYARKNGIRQLELAVSAENTAARRFYEREGFHEAGRIPGGFIHNSREIDDVIMVRRINDQENVGSRR